MIENKKKTTAGRPPKYLNSKIEERKGILSAPSSKDNCFEMEHNNTDIFKAIFDAGKQIHKTAIIIINENTLKLYFNSQSGCCTGTIEIYGSRVCGFYSVLNKNYKCSVEQVIKILKAKKKNHEKISFFITNSELFTLNIKMSSGEDVSENWVVPLESIDPVDLTEYDHYYKDLPNYPLKFTLEWAYFKEIVNTWKTFTNNNIIFTKDQGPLKISFKDAQNESTITFHNGNKINLQYDSDDFLAVSIPIINLMSCSSNDSLANAVCFNVAENKKMILTAKLDECYHEKKKPIENTESATVKFFLSL